MFLSADLLALPGVRGPQFGNRCSSRTSKKKKSLFIDKPISTAAFPHIRIKTKCIIENNSVKPELLPII
jgi:hypothetical protein